MRYKALILTGIVFGAFVLRIYQIRNVPPALYWDEASLGYNAYSILKTGHDEHGEFMPLARFIAFGDYKPPGYIYATIPAIALFGLTEFAVRLPSVLAGTLAVFMTFFLSKKLFHSEKIAILSSFLLAISSWHIQLSRGAFEANLAMFFNLSGITFALYAREKKYWLLIPSALSFVFAFYTFNANRITAPLIALVIGIIFLKDWLHAKKWIIVAVICAVLLLIPSISYLRSRESKVRFQEVSILTNLETLKKSNDRIARDSWFLPKILDNRRIMYALDFFRHYFDNFQPAFLFIHGDGNPRLSIQEVGELYLIHAPFLFLGIYLLFSKYWSKEGVLLMLWTLIIPIPAGLARETPHALRIVSLLPVPQLLIALGLWHSIQFFNKQKRIYAMGVYIVLVSASMFYYLHNYYIHYPIIWSGEWQYGYKQIVQKVSQIKDQYDHIVITNSLGRPYIYFLFYEQTNPQNYWKNRDANRDWAGLWTVYGYDTYRFNIADANNLSGKNLLVGKPGEIPESAQVIDTIHQLNGEIVFILAEQQ